MKFNKRLIYYLAIIIIIINYNIYFIFFANIHSKKIIIIYINIKFIKLQKI